MTQRQKLIDAFRARPPDVSFSDAKMLLGMFGFMFDHQSGSHAIFRNVATRQIISIPKDGGQRVKRTYVIKICEILGLDDE